MGSYLCRETEKPCEQVHEQHFPMYLVKVADFLQMQGPPEPHHLLKQQNLLHEWSPGMLTIFVSHQWLGATLPDPKGQQLAVLRNALVRMIEGSLSVDHDLVSMRPGAESLPAAIRSRLSTGYIFLDWFAIPQLTARQEGTNEDRTQTDAALAIQSIPAYVEVADVFVALVPELTHMDTGMPCNYRSWLSRGWCRAELWCHLLSNKPDTSVILVFSAREAEFMSPLNWQRHTVAEGDFTVERDREVVVKLGEAAVESKIQHLSRVGPLSHCRFYMAHRPKLLGQARQHLDLHTFLSHYRFPSLRKALEEVDKMTPLLCALFAGDVQMVRSLIELKADVNAKLSGLGELGYFNGQTPLMAAAKSYQEPEMLVTLAELRADVNAVSGAGVNAAYLVRTPAQVQVLLEARADMHSPCVWSGLTPLTGAASMADPQTVKALLMARCAVNPSLVGMGYTPLHGLVLFSRANRHAEETARMLLAHRADLNTQARCEGTFGWICKASTAYVSFMGYESRSMPVRFFASLKGLTPLGLAALVGDKGLTRLFLEQGAEMTPNARGDGPEELARANEHLHLLPMLATFHV
ncbi:unnamed protein product [Effrenium voratum]|uniref:Uncharacterized protein n=1 Tax=Effrenium voratum TaxID=2562239 RepID=A0AA36HNU0_9DINO|nr:unnamed protein product [Effrenium voratum]CAJ1434899.1 unnamed protein product [Effrenium voratum]